MKNINSFGKPEKIMLGTSILCFAAGVLVIAFGREWTIIGILMILIHGLLLMRIISIQADSIDRIVKEREDYMQQQRKENLSRKVSYLKEEIQETHRKMNMQKELEGQKGLEELEELEVLEEQKELQA